MNNNDLHALRDELRNFAADRDWDQFHTPKNLATALNVEAGELLEHFQWLRDEESIDLPQVTRQDVADEIADVFLYLIRLADKLNVDLITVAHSKIKKNAEKYPIELSRGNATKHTKLGS